MKTQPGFTLIEMLAVIAVMALLSAAASIGLSGSRHKADLQQATEELRQADLSARTLARSTGQPVILSIDLTTGKITRSGVGGNTLLGQLPADVKIQRARTNASTVDFGSVNIRFGASTGSDSYAIKLLTASGASRWTVFAGLSGQPSTVNDDEIDAIFDQIAPTAGSGIDAN